MKEFITFKEFNRYCGFEEPKSELLDIGRYDYMKRLDSEPIKLNFYRVSLKFNFEDPELLGKTENDPSKGLVYFSPPGQITSWSTKEPIKGFYINVNPLIFKEYTHLAYNFTKYASHEALFLTPDEERKLITVFDQLLSEYNNNNSTMDIQLAYCNIVFSYIDQFYKRQFSTRREYYSHLVNKFFDSLKGYYDQDTEDILQMPTLQYFSNELNVSPVYLSDLLKSNTGVSALGHIHAFIMKEAEFRLKYSEQTISEIAYELGFEYPTYFSRLFKKVKGVTPSEFRNDWN